MLQNSFYAISGTFYTLLNNTDLYLSYFILSYVFLGHNDSVEWGLTVLILCAKQIAMGLDILDIKMKNLICRKISNGQVGERSCTWLEFQKLFQPNVCTL